VAFPKNLLHKEEQLILDLRPHWWFMFGPVVAVIVATIVAILVLANDLHDVVKILAGVALVAAAVWLAIRWAKWATTNFVVTSDRLVYRHGVLSKSGIEIPLDRVNTIFFNQSLFERMLGSGDLVIESAGEKGQSHFTDIRKPSLVQNVIYQQIEDNENRKFDRAAGGKAAAAPASIPQQIDQLDDLRRRGVISQEEFDAKKAQLLDRL
jgi:uncharacterized membrane protein YdbT with pleckstrin-like domain